MKLAFIRVRSNSAASTRNSHAATGLARTGSSSKNLIQALRQQQIISSAEEWQFVSGTVPPRIDQAPMPIKFWPTESSRLEMAIDRTIADADVPDILWVEGVRCPPYLNTMLRAFPRSFKLVYSKHWEPWTIEQLDCFDLCLVDEHHQIAEVHQEWPQVHCGVWDKLVDYEQTHRPLECPKTYDVCYVAYLRRRKKHEVLFSALSKLRHRGLSCVCVGEDRKGFRSELERRATELDIRVEFTGEVDAQQVNQYVNRSRIGVVCSRRDAVPRAILECLAANVPVLVNSKLVAGTRYVGAASGLVRPADEFHRGIEELLDQRQNFDPRREYLANFSADQVVRRFVRILTEAGLSIPQCAGVDGP